MSFRLLSLQTYSDNLQTHVVIFGKSFAQRKCEYNKDEMNDASHNDANNEFPLSNQPLGEDLIAALKE